MPVKPAWKRSVKHIGIWKDTDRFFKGYDQQHRPVSTGGFILRSYYEYTHHASAYNIIVSVQIQTDFLKGTINNAVPFLRDGSFKQPDRTDRQRLLFRIRLSVYVYLSIFLYKCLSIFLESPSGVRTNVSIYQPISCVILSNVLR